MIVQTPVGAAVGISLPGPAAAMRWSRLRLAEVIDGVAHHGDEPADFKHTGGSLVPIDVDWGR